MLVDWIDYYQPAGASCFRKYHHSFCAPPCILYSYKTYVKQCKNLLHFNNYKFIYEL